MSPKQIKLKSAVESYIQHLQDKGQKHSTVGTARRTLALLVAEMGEEKDVAKILPVHVNKFFHSEAATMLRGKPRAQASVLQIRRVVRGALVHWHDRRWLASVPLPASDKHFLEPKEKKDQPKQAKASKSKQQHKEAAETELESSPAKEADTISNAPAIQIVREAESNAADTATKEG
jgi:hypothetical protein